MYTGLLHITCRKGICIWKHLIHQRQTNIWDNHMSPHQTNRSAYSDHGSPYARMCSWRKCISVCQFILGKIFFWKPCKILKTSWKIPWNFLYPSWPIWTVVFQCTPHMVSKMKHNAWMGAQHIDDSILMHFWYPPPLVRCCLDTLQLAWKPQWKMTIEV